MRETERVRDTAISVDKEMKREGITPKAIIVVSTERETNHRWRCVGVHAQPLPAIRHVAHLCHRWLVLGALLRRRDGCLA